MSDTVHVPPTASTPPAGAPVLGYQAIQQKRWERGIFWLASIILITQFLSFAASLADGYSDVYSPWRVAIFNGAILLHSSRALISLAAAICTSIFLINRRWAHRGLILCAWLMVLFCVIATLCSMVYRDTYESFDPSVSYNPMHETIAQKAADLVLWSYPLLLLSAVLERRGGTGRKWSTSAIWSLTAVAALLISLPGIVAWITGLNSTYLHTASGVAEDFTGIWFRKVIGVGMIACAIASFGTPVAAAWTYLRGASGRPLLIVCTAFWIIYAVTVFGTLLCITAASFFRYRYFMYWVLPTATSQFRYLVSFLAFPLAIHVALTLSDVRAKLEGKA